MMTFVPPEAMVGGKRRATSGVTVVSARTSRNTDKKMIGVALDAISATQQSTVLLTVTFPCTIQGLRWNMAIIQDAGTGNCEFHWAIVVLRDGLTLPVMSVGDGATLYQPEQDVLVYGVGIIDNNTASYPFAGSTKTMRKLMGGDRLVFIAKGVATNFSRIRGVIQFFCKT